MKPILACLLLPAALHGHPSHGIVVDHAGDIWFSDVIQNRVLRLDARGHLQVERTGVHSHFLWLASDGAVHGEHLWYDAARGTFPSYSWRMPASGRFEKLAQAPDRVLKDARGHRYHALADRIVRTAADGRQTHPGGVPFAGVARGKYERLTGLALDPEGSLYVADLEQGVLRRVAPDGRLHDHWRPEAPWAPWGVAWHGGALYVIEHERGLGARTRIVRVSAAGQGQVLWQD